MATIIQSLKRIKHLERKITVTKERIQRWSSYFSDEDPTYTDIRALLQSVNDMQTEICKIRHAIHVANATKVVEFKGKSVTIDELLLEATVLIPAKIEALQCLQRKEKNPYMKNNENKVVLQYDPKEKDKELDALNERASDINDFLDMINIQEIV